MKRLAIGGMGEIFLARQIGSAGFERPVIIKRLLPDLVEDESAVEEFVNEARIAATLNHPNIVAVYEVSEWRGMYFIVMEYIEGETIAAILQALAKKQAPFPHWIIARIIHDAALALDHAHNAAKSDGTPLRIIHRDISPQNIMVRKDGVTKVVDFGIAKVADRSGRTASGVLKGKLRYMPPEQLREEPLDARSDQFSLGVTLWEMCTGRRLFKKDISLSARLRVGRIPRASTIHPDVPTALDEIAERMLQSNRELRFPSCLELARALDHYLASPEGRTDLAEISAFVIDAVGDRIAERGEILRSGEAEDEVALLAAPPPAPEPPPTPPERRRAATWIPVSIVLGAIALAAFAVMAVREAEQPPVVIVERASRPIATPPPEQAKAKPASLDVRLTRAFSSRRREVEGCFERFGQEAPEEVAVRFEIDKTGRVTSAQIHPREIEPKELGVCLSQLARTTKFPRQKRAVAFRIPLRIAR